MGEMLSVRQISFQNFRDRAGRKIVSGRLSALKVRWGQKWEALKAS